jgi:hypothetical protein
MRKMDFEKTLLEAVDHALLTIGETPREAIYYHLEKGFRLRREDIPEDADEFSQALNNIFGPGAEVIERLIVKNLFGRLNLNFEEKTRFEFLDYVSLAREIARREKERIKVRMIK